MTVQYSRTASIVATGIDYNVATSFRPQLPVSGSWRLVADSRSSTIN